MYFFPFFLFVRTAFKFGRRVHCALRRKMRKPPNTRVPAILNGLKNRPSWKTGSIYAEIVKWRSTRPRMNSIQVNSKFEWRKWLLKSISICTQMHFCLLSYSVHESWHIFVKYYLLKKRMGENCKMSKGVMMVACCHVFGLDSFVSWKGGFYMALGNCVHMFRPYCGPHRYSVNQLWLYDVFTARQHTTKSIPVATGLAH